MKPKDNQKSYTPGKKVFDVARPGRTPASPSARPVISSRKTVDDPDISSKRSLMNPKQKITINPTDGSAPEGQKVALKPRQKEPDSATTEERHTAPPVKIDTDKNPPGQPEKPPVKIEAATDKAGQAKEDEPVVANPPETEQTKPVVKAEPETDEQPPREPSRAEPATSQPTEPARSERVEPMHMGMPKELSGSGAVVSQHGKRRTLGLEILSILIILLLLAATADLLLDAEIIKTDLDIPHTDFFRPV